MTNRASEFEGHTPGPWEWGCDDAGGEYENLGEAEYRYLTPKEGVRAVIELDVLQPADRMYDNDIFGMTVRLPDARLIAAAPRLLAERDALVNGAREASRLIDEWLARVEIVGTSAMIIAASDALEAALAGVRVRLEKDE